MTDLDDAASRGPEFIAALAARGSFRSVHALPISGRALPHGRD